MKELIVIGAGAAGMLAAGTAAGAGVDTWLLEKNAKAGRKIGITGKGRCNLTNHCDEKTFIDHVVNNPRFLYSAIRGLNPQAVMDLVEENGTPLKVERGERVFPVSDKAFDIIDALCRYVRKSGAKLLTDRRVRHIIAKDGYYQVLLEDEVLEGRAVILCAGGLSYPATGSTGDGLRIAAELGLEIEPPRPALIPLVPQESWCKDLMGLSLKNVRIRLLSGKGKEIYTDFGEMLFTHFGVSGPIILSASSYLNRYLRQSGEDFSSGIRLLIDLKPALDEETLDARLQRDLNNYRSREFQNALGDLLPKRLIPIVVSLSGIEGTKRAGEVSRGERRQLGSVLKALPLHIKGARPLEEAIVTSGGVKVSQLNPKTMMVKAYPGLFLAGEMVDVDAVTGGFNLQSAFAMGHAAGLGAAAYLQSPEQ